tara:strand:- start:9420 stop:9917 length:498 start_codon:yes stop_codon:yes gene_type:complete
MVQKVIATELASSAAKNKATPYIVGVVVLGAVALTYFGITRPLLCYFKVLKNCKGSKLEQELFSLDAFNPKLANPKNVTITYDRAKALAEQISDAIGYTINPKTWFDDDEEAVYGAVQSAGSVYNMSLVSRMYEAKYGESLSGRIGSKFNPAEMEKVKTIIKNYK